MRFIDAEEIHRLLDFPSLVAALEAGHRRKPMELQDGILGSDEARYFVRHAVDPGRYFASKLITNVPANLAGGCLPAVQAVVVLFDGHTGAPAALMDGTAITWWRTAADSALGAKRLARPDAQSLLVVGAGALAPWLVRAHVAVHPGIRHVKIWNRTPTRAEECTRLLAREGIDARACDDLASAVSGSDIVTTCTRSRTPLIRGEWLRPGMHLDLVGGYTPQMREADDEAMRRSTIYVDRHESAFDGVGDIVQPIASGAIRESDILGDLHGLMDGRIPGRQTAAQITCFKNAGGAHLDLMTAELVLARIAARPQA